MMAAEELIVSKHGRVKELRLNRPEKRNAISRSLLESLWRQANLFAENDDLQVLMLTAEGPFFSAGADISGELQPDFRGSTRRARYEYGHGAKHWHRLGDLFEAVGKPIVVAHHGPCLGGAFELSLCCDFRFATPETFYGLPEIEMGVLPGSGGVSRLTRLAGPHWARWLAMAGQRITAERALQIGLVHDIYPATDFAVRVWEFCERLASLPPEAVAMAKVAIDLTAELGRADSRVIERLGNATLFVGDEHADRLQAYKSRLKESRVRK
jgi:enoyl-CoA hydratase